MGGSVLFSACKGKETVVAKGFDDPEPRFLLGGSDTLQFRPHVANTGERGGEFIPRSQHADLLPHKPLQFRPHAAQSRFFAVRVCLPADHGIQLVYVSYGGICHPASIAASRILRSEAACPFAEQDSKSTRAEM